MSQLGGFVMEGKESFLCKLKKSLYGLKQAPRAWYKNISGYFEDIRFAKCFSEFDLYVELRVTLRGGVNQYILKFYLFNASN